jgi:hypothetical protein
MPMVHSWPLAWARLLTTLEDILSLGTWIPTWDSDLLAKMGVIKGVYESVRAELVTLKNGYSGRQTEEDALMERRIRDEVRGPAPEVAIAFYGYIRVKRARAEEITVTLAHHATLAEWMRHIKLFPG